MAVEKCILRDARTAGADFTGQLLHFAHMDTDGDLVLAAAGEAVYGVVVEEAASGGVVTVDLLGIAKVIAGATVAPGALVASDANAEAVTATTGDSVAGVARTGGDAGEVIEIVLVPSHNAA